MKKALYTVSNGTTEHKLLATSYSQALAWVEANDPKVTQVDELSLERFSGLVDLTAPAEPVKAPKDKVDAPVDVRVVHVSHGDTDDDVDTDDEQDADVQEEAAIGEISNQEAADRLGCNLKRIANLRYTGALEAGSRAHVTLASVLAYEAKNPPEVKAPAKPKEAKPATEVSSGPWSPVPRPNDTMLHEDKVAVQLGLTVAQVREVKRHGNVPGGNGWVNLTVLQSYMAHPDYEPPFATA
jgi:hypothetical protein